MNKEASFFKVQSMDEEAPEWDENEVKEASKKLGEVQRWLLFPNGQRASVERINAFLEAFYDFSELNSVQGRDSPATRGAHDRLLSEFPEWANEALAMVDEATRTRIPKESWYRDGLGH